MPMHHCVCICLQSIPCASTPYPNQVYSWGLKTPYAHSVLIEPSLQSIYIVLIRHINTSTCGDIQILQHTKNNYKVCIKQVKIQFFFLNLDTK